MTAYRNVVHAMDGYRIVGIAPKPASHPLAFSACAVVDPDGVGRMRTATFDAARIRREERRRRHRTASTATRPC